MARAPCRRIPPSAMSATPDIADRQAAIDQRLRLRHAEAGRHARRATAAGADADLDPVHAALEQKPGALGGTDVAGDQLDVAEPLAHLPDRAIHHDRMTMRDVDDQDVDARLDQLRGALEIIALRTDRGADQETTLLVAGGERESPLLQQVAGGDQPDQLAAGTHERQLLDLALHHHALGFFRGDGAGVHDQALERRHAIGHARPGARHESKIPLGQEALEPAVAVDDDEGADSRPRHHRRRLFDRGVRRDAVRIADDAVLGALDDLDLADLRLDVAGAEPAIDYAKAPLLGLDDGHRRSRDGVHVGRDNRALQRDVLRDATRQINRRRVASIEDAHLRRQEKIVERAASRHLGGLLRRAGVDAWKVRSGHTEILPARRPGA